MYVHEFGKRCGLCWKYKRSRIYHSKVKGKWRKICADCWEAEERKRRRKRCAMCDELKHEHEYAGCFDKDSGRPICAACEATL